MTTILAFDGATINVGYALIDCKTGIRLKDWGKLKLKGDMPTRLAQLHVEVDSIIQNHKPTFVAVEDLKINRGTPNLPSKIKVGYAIGTILSVCGMHGYDNVHLIAANSVRKSWDVTQKKEALRKAVNNKFIKDLQQQGRPEGFKTSDEDVTDAIGLAVASWPHFKKLC